MAKGCFKSNRIIANHGGWLEIDVSTKKFPVAIMKINTSDWCCVKKKYVGRVYAVDNNRGIAYAAITTKGKSVRVHRVIFDVAPTLYIDHVNHDGLDNRRCNLRKVTNSQNSMNGKKRKVNTSGVIGVDWLKDAKRWRVRICKNFKSIYIGRFVNKHDAITARRSAEQKHFGEFAYVGTTQ